MNILAFDTETTGKYYFGQPDTDLSQPHIVQLAAVLVVDSVIHSEMHVLIEPVRAQAADEPYPIKMTDEAQAIHGISIDMLEEYGADFGSVASIFEQWCRKADLILGHNIDFDMKMIRSEFARFGLDDPFAGKPAFCTMQKSTNVCRLAGRRPGQFKWPTLQEAHQHFYGKRFEGAHGAKADIYATLRVYKALMKVLESSIDQSTPAVSSQ